MGISIKICGLLLCMAAANTGISQSSLSPSSSEVLMKKKFFAPNAPGQSAAEEECCEDYHRVADPSYNFLSQGDFMLGTGSNFSYKSYQDQRNEFDFGVGLIFGYYLSEYFGAALELGYGGERINFAQGNYAQKFSTLNLSPSVSAYYNPFNRNREGITWSPSLTLEANLGIGSYSTTANGTQVNKEAVRHYGLNLRPGILWNPCDRYYIGASMNLLGWQQNRFLPENAPDPFIQNRTNVGLNRGYMNLDFYYRMGSRNRSLGIQR